MSDKPAPWDKPDWGLQLHTLTGTMKRSSSPAWLANTTASNRRRAKLSPDQARLVHQMAAEGFTQYAIGRHFGVSHAAVRSILLGWSFKEVWLERYPGKSPKVRKR